MAEGFSIRIVDAAGNPLDDLVSDQLFYVELYVPKSWEDPGNTTVVEFVTSEGTADLEITWTGETDSEWKFTSTPITVSGGAEGGGEVGALGFSWSTGGLDRGEIDYEDNAPLTVRWENAGGRVAQDSVVLYDTAISMGLAQTAAYIAKADEVYRQTLINVAAARDDLAQYPDSDEKAEVEQALDSLEAEASSRMRFLDGARAALDNAAWTDHARLAVAGGYLHYLAYSPDLLAAVPWTDVLRLESANKEASDEEVRQRVWQGLNEALIGGYRLFAHATLVAQVRTLFFGVNEMGQQVGWDERTVALLDLITEAALMGAGMRFQLDHLATPTRPRLRVGTSTGVDAPRFQGPRLAGADTGDLLAPEQVGMLRDATVDAQRIARVPRDGYPDGTLIWTRPSNVAGLEWRAQGHPPKGTDIKSKTINDIDVLLGAEPGTQGLVGFFEPVLPSSAGFDPAFFAKIEGRFNQRTNEFNGGIGDHMRHLAEDGQIRFDNGVVVDTGLYGNTGKGITGDYDLFEITDLNGDPVSTAVYDQIVGELMSSAPFQALHGAHMRWLDLPDFRKPAKLRDNLDIFTNVVGKHQRGGDEPLVVFGGDRPPFAVWSEDVPTRHLADLPDTVAATFARNMSRDGVLITGITPLFLDPDAGDGWESDWDDLVRQSQSVLDRGSLLDEDGDDQLPDPPPLDIDWDEFIAQAEAAERNPSVLDYLNESPFAPPPPDWRPGQPPEEGAEDTAEEPDQPDPDWDAVVAQAEARVPSLSVLDHETGIDEDSARDPGDPAPVPPEESVLNYLHGEPDLGPTPIPPSESVLNNLDDTPATEGATPVTLPSKFHQPPGGGGRKKLGVPLWGWVVGAAVPFAVGAYLVFGGGDPDDDPDTTSGAGLAASPVATAPPSSSPAASPTPEVTATPVTTPTIPAGATMTAVDIPTLVICPDGSTFSAFAQPDGTYRDAETNEPRACPPPPN